MLPQPEASRHGASEATAWMQAVIDIAKEAGADKPLEALFDLVAATAARLTNTPASALQIASADGVCLRIEGHKGLSAEYVERVNREKMIALEPGSPYYLSPSSQAYRTGSIVVVDDTSEDVEYTPWFEVASSALDGGEAYRSLAAVPMAAEGENVGVLAVYSLDHGVATPEVMAMLTLLAEHTALAVTLARVRTRERASLQKLTRAHASLQRQQAVLDQADDLHQGLMRAVLHDDGLAKIVGTTASVLGLRVVLEDTLGNVLVCAPDSPSQDDRDRWRTSEAGLAATHAATESRGIEYVSPPTPQGPGAWIAPLVLAEEIVAWLWAFGEDADESELQRRLLERAAMAVTVELWREQSAREIEWRLSGDLLDHLLRDGVVDSQTALTRAAHLGFDLSVPHTLVLVGVRTGADDIDAAELNRRVLLPGLEYAMRGLNVKALQAWREGAAVLFLSSRDAAGKDEVRSLVHRLGRDLGRHLPGRDIVVVTSGPCEDLSDYGDAYRSAAGAVSLAWSDRPEQAPGLRFLDVSGMGVYSVLLGTTRTADLLRLRDATLRSLEEHDRRKGAQLVLTLREYLASGCKIQSTATNLFMHPNTVMYRLKTIERITNLDLHQPEALLQAQLAIMIDDVTGRASREPS